MQVLTLAAFFDSMAKQDFTADGCLEESVSVGGMRTRLRFFSPSLTIILRKRKVLGKDKWKLFTNFKFITPQISCLDKSEKMTTVDNEIIKNQ